MKNYDNIYNLNKEWLEEIAPNYLELKGLAKHNVSTFGYINSVMRNITEDTINTNANLFYEIFPSTAKLPSTLLYYSQFMNIGEINAIPATMEIMFAIDIDYIMENATYRGRDFVFKLEEDNVIYIEDIPYRIDYPIIINGYSSENGKYKYICSYDMSIQNKLSDVSIPYIKNIITDAYGSKYIAMQLIIRQVNKQRISKKILENDPIALRSLIFNYDDQYCNMEVDYIKADGSRYKMEALTEDKKPLTSPYFYHNVTDNDIELSFSNSIGYFTPEYNSDLEITINTCIGSKANISYSGKISIYNENGSDLLNYCKLSSETDSVGGVDKISLDKLKDKVNENYLGTPDIIRENDLKTYFKSLDVNNIVPVKTRDDFERIFSVFNLLKDSKGNQIHTNTLNMSIWKNEFDKFYENSKKRQIKVNRILQYVDDIDLDNVKIYDGDKNINDIINEKDNSNDFLYTNPFLMIINQQPHRVNYYFNSVNDSYLTKFKDIDRTVEEQCLINKLNIKRNAFKSDKFEFRLSLLPVANIELDDIVTRKEETDELIDNGVMKVVLVFRDTNNSIIGYKIMTMEDVYQEKFIDFYTEITTDDYISDSNKISIKQSINDFNTGNIIDTALPINNMRISILVCVENDNAIKNEYNQNIPELLNNSIANEYEVDEISIIKDLNNFMTSNLKVTNITEDNFRYLIKNVPLVRYQLCQEDDYVFDIIRNINNFMNIYKRIKFRLENNFSINYKFFNNYGRSKYFKIGNKDMKLINSTNVSMKFTIKIFDLTMSEQTQKEIKSDIIEYLNSVNDSNIYISDLITKLNIKYDNKVEFIIFDNINNYDSSYQRIINNSPDIYDYKQADISSKYIPESINVKTIKDNKTGNYIPQIELEIVTK